MPVVNGVFTPLTLDDALNEIIAAAGSSILFAPGNPPELILANMFAQASVLIDADSGEIMAEMMSPVGSMIDLMNPNNPRKAAISATGYIVTINATGADIDIPAGEIFTAATGQQYETGAEILTVPAHDTLNVLLTAITAGIAGNIPAAESFTVSALSLSATNPLPFLSGADAESDAIYLNRLVGEKTEYGTQNGSVAVETELKRYYPDAYMYVNNTGTGLVDPVHVPANGYNVIVKTPSGILAEAAEIAQIFKTLSNRLEFVNSQTTGDTLHMVLSGSVVSNGVPLSYFFTVAQPVDTAIDIVIQVRASKNAATDELIIQANNFAVYFINRLMRMFSGIGGTTDVIFDDGSNPPVTTSIDVVGISAQAGTIGPQFGIGTIMALVNDIDTMGDTPQILFDEVSDLTITIDPDTQGESPIILNIGGGSAITFIDFKNDALFSDNTSYYDRFMFIDPANISVTLEVVAWI